MQMAIVARQAAITNPRQAIAILHRRVGPLKVEAVRLVGERGVSVAQAARSYSNFTGFRTKSFSKSFS